MAENGGINPGREFTFPLSENINHLKHRLERLYLFLRSGVCLPGFPSQPRERYSVKILDTFGWPVYVYSQQKSQYWISKRGGPCLSTEVTSWETRWGLEMSVYFG